MPPPSAPQARTTAHPACAPTTTPTTTAPSSSTLKATTLRRCAIGRSRLRTVIRLHWTGGFAFELPDCVAASDKDWRAPFRTGREPGCAPGGAVTFFMPKKVTKKGLPCCLRPLRCATGQPASGHLRGAPWNSLRCYAATFEQPRRASQRSMRAPARMPPRKHPATGASTRAWTATRAERSDRPVWLFGFPLPKALVAVPRSAAAGGSGLASV